MLNFIEKWFESCLWNGRFVVVLVVVASMAAAFAIFYMATVDVIYLVNHMLHYADSSLTEGARKLLHDQTISHVVEVVDGYLLATFMLIFSFGMYELFISETSSKILVISNLDDLKARLAKVILMILIVTLFEEALNMKITSALDLFYLSGAIALIGAALFLTHKAEEHGKDGKHSEG